MVQANRPKLLVIDNYDSFTFNLVQMFMKWPLDILVFRSDRIQVAEALALSPDYVLISPGPKDPSQAGISKDLIQGLTRDVPLLGVCLGMQCMNEAFGGKTSRAPVPMHGKVSRIDHENRALFQGLANRFVAARYHSLMVEDVPPELKVTARSEDQVIMGLSHRNRPFHGVQFHPESFMTEQGNKIVENFLKLGPIDSWGQAA